MYTVLLVDDEEDVLNNLKNTIDWPVYGAEIILTAKDGLDALEKLKSHFVNLLITDIRMPHMDGIQLIKRVHEEYPYTRCIFLSSYSDFSYAKEALSLGVENYILKPFNINELENSIRQSLDNISMHKHIMHTLFLDNVLYRWINDDISMDELSERSKHISINIYFRNYCVLLLDFAQKKLLDTFLSSLFSLLNALYDVYHFVNYDGYHVVILGGHAVTQESISSALKQVEENHHFSTQYFASVGIVANGCENVFQSYQSALEGMLSQQISPDQHIHMAASNVSLELTPYQLNLITDYLKMPDLSVEEKQITSLFHEIFSDIHSYSLQDTNAYVHIVSVRLALRLTTLGLIDSEDKNNIINTSYHFETSPSEHELNRWFSSLLSICHALIRKHEKHLSPIVLSAMDYISANYAEYASIKDFCNKHNMNASYFGLRFRKETGIYFNDYVNQIRINHAIQLIQHSNLKIAEICQKIGFINTSYFILCFKKQTGVSPSKFRQLHTNS